MTNKLNCAQFNSQQDAFAVASDQGIRVFNTFPTVLLASLDAALVGSVRACAIVARSNLIAFAGSGRLAKFPNNTVFIYDHRRKELVFEIVLNHGPVLNILLSTTRMVIVQENHVHVFSFPDPCTHLRTFKTRANPHGICAISGENAVDNQIIVYPAFKLGHIEIVNMKNISKSSLVHPKEIKCHLTEIVQIAANTDGTLVATGSNKGTLVRVFNARTGDQLTECRRGSDSSTLHCLQFSPCSGYLVVTSDKGTIHIFTIRVGEGPKKTLLQQCLGKQEIRACVQISLDAQVLKAAFIRGVNSSRQFITVICIDGTYHRFSFEQQRGSAQREGFDYVMQLADEQEFWTKPF